MTPGSQQWWYLARASGLVAWALLGASIVWGLLLATRTLGRRPSPRWLSSMHQYIGGLAVTFTAVHVAAVAGDTYVHFGWADVFVPFASRWHPVAVAWGVIALYLLVAVEGTSLLKRHLPKRLWRNVHLLSYPLFQVATVHLLSAGTDSRRVLAPGVAIALGTVLVLVTFGGYRRREKLGPGALQASSSGTAGR